MQALKRIFDKNNTIIILSTILFIALIKVLPYSSTENKVFALLIFVGVLWLTEALHITVTALLIPILAVLLGLMDVGSSLAQFANPIIFLFFGGFALATALSVQGLDKLIAKKIIAIAKGNLLLTMVYFLLFTAFLSMWVSNTATVAVMLPLAMGLVKQLAEQDNKGRIYTFLLLGIAYSASIGGMGTLVGSPPNAIVASQLNLTFIEWMYYGIPVVVILLPLMFFVLYFLFKPQLNQTIKQEEEVLEFDRKKIITLVIFVAVASCWIFSSKLNPLLSGWLGLESKIKSFDSLIAIIGAVLICILRVSSWKQIQTNTDWGLLMLFGGGLTLSSILSTTGVSQFMAEGIIGFIQNSHMYIIVLVVATFIMILTEFTSNTASAALFIPLFISVAQSLGIPSVGLAAIVAFGASSAFALPVATPPNAIVFSTGQVKQRDMLRAGVLLNIFAILIVSILAYNFWI